MTFDNAKHCIVTRNRRGKVVPCIDIHQRCDVCRVAFAIIWRECPRCRVCSRKPGSCKVCGTK